MKSIREDLGSMDAPAPTHTDPECPGASLRVTRDAMYELQRGGVRFKGKADRGEGEMMTVRSLCSDPVARLPRTASGHTQFYGLCSSCNELEVANRAWLRARRGDR